MMSSYIMEGMQHVKVCLTVEKQPFLQSQSDARADGSQVRGHETCNHFSISIAADIIKEHAGAFIVAKIVQYVRAYK